MSTSRNPAGADAPASQTPNNGTKVMDCSSDPTEFTTVQIHTAKCAICDQRNMATMRRCPGCTYQVCQPCFDSRNGAPLLHGNQGIGSSGLMATPVRRRVMNRADARGSPAVAPRTAGTNPALGVGKQGTQASAAQATSAPTRRTHPKRKSKSKAKVQDSDDDDEDEDFAPDLQSPTPIPKRRKTIGEVDKPTQGADSGKSTTSPRLTRKQPANKVKQQSTASLSSTTTQQGQGLSNVGMKERGETVQLTPQEEIRELMRQHGVDTPENPYKEHLLGRHMPPMSNPVIPPYRFPASPLAAQSGRKSFQKAATENSTGLHAGGKEDTKDKQIPEPLTLRKFVEQQEALNLQRAQLDDDQKQILHGTVLREVRDALAKFQQGLLPRPTYRYSFDSIMDDFSFPQTAELELVISTTVEVELQELGVVSNAAHMSTPSRRDSETAVTLANMSMSSPPIGLFTVSPVTSHMRRPSSAAAVSQCPLPGIASLLASPPGVRIVPGQGAPSGPARATAGASPSVAPQGSPSAKSREGNNQGKDTEHKGGNEEADPAALHGTQGL